MREFYSTIQLLSGSLFYYVTYVGLDGNYTYVNKHFADSFCYVDGNLVGKPYYLTMHPEDIVVCDETSAKCIQHRERTFPATIRKDDGNGGYIVTQWEFKAGFDEAGELDGIFCMGYDITELDKTKDLLKNIAFQQSHVVRKPLANIIGIAHILDKMDFDNNTKSLVSMMSQNAAELDAVINSIIEKTDK